MAITAGLATGVGLFTFRYAEGLSYFSTDPTACTNCHIMQRQFNSWEASSHHANAVCVDCHLPHDFVPKYLAKAENGWRHGKEFTAQSFSEPIELKPGSREILQANCRRCHSMISEPLLLSHDGSAPECVHCHAGAGHGDRAALGGPQHNYEESNPNE